MSCKYFIPFTIATLTISAPATAATPDVYAKIDKASEVACLKAAGLTNATAGPALRYSDKVMVDARILEGVRLGTDAKVAKAKLLCLYNRKNKRVEVQELAAPPAPLPPVKDVWWMAKDIGGKGIIDGSEVTLMFSSDGKIGGRSGCNGYSANYRMDGEGINVVPPMISTKMVCASSVMSQEQAYQKLVEMASSFSVTPDGALLVKSADGSTTRFVRK